MRSLRGIVLCGVLVMSQSGCPADREASPRPRATPGAGFARGVDGIPAADVARYVAQLEFDTSVAAGDAQYFMQRGRAGVGLGHYVTIAPEIGSTTLPRDSLAAGRIIARLTFSRGVDTVRAQVYYWVDSAGGSWRNALLAADGGLVSGPFPMQIHAHPGGGDRLPYMPPRARLITVAGFELPETVCIFCSDRRDWCGRDEELLHYDGRFKEYLDQRLGELDRPPGGLPPLGDRRPRDPRLPM